MRKTIYQIVEDAKKQDNALVMNSDQRLERARLLNAAEFGALCIAHWAAIRLCLLEYNTDEKLTALRELSHLYEVAK